MDYSKIIKHSWDIIKRRKYLWWLGLIAMFAESGARLSFPSSSGYNFGGNTPAPPSNIPTNGTATLTSTFANIPRVLGTSSDYTIEYFRLAGVWLSENIILLFVITVVFLLLLLLIGYISNTAMASLILSVDRIEKSKKELNFKESFREGLPFAWKLIGLNIFLSSIILAIILLLGLVSFTPYLINRSDGLLPLGMILFLFGLIPIFLLGIYLTIIRRLSSRYLVLNNGKILDSIKKARAIFHYNFGKTLLLWLLEAVINTALAFALIIAFAIGGILLAFLGYVLSLANNYFFGAIILVLIAAFLAALFAYSAVVTTYFSTYWTISFRALDYLYKTRKTNHGE